MSMWLCLRPGCARGIVSRSKPATPLGERRYEVVWEHAVRATNFRVMYQWLQLVLGSVECGMDSVKAAEAASKELGL
jgi:hypothetical protein